MKRRANSALCIWGIFGLFTGLLSVYMITITFVLPLKREMDVTATQSTAASLLATVQTIEEIRIPTGEWHELDDETYARVVKLACDQGRFDASGGSITPSNSVVDPWGGRFRIAVRRTDEGGKEYFVWSRGPDQTAGTEDDVVAPPYLWRETSNLHDDHSNGTTPAS